MKMSSKTLLFLFHLSALVSCLLGQATFPGSDEFYAGSGYFSGYPDRGFGDLVPEASFNDFQNANEPGFGKEFINGPNHFNSDFDRVSQRQFPFFFNNNQLFPNFPLRPQQQLPPPFINYPQFTPWWQGDNVCVSKEESTEEWTGNEVGLATQPDYSVNLRTCAEKNNRHICKTTTNKNGKKLTIVATRQCCIGYARFPHRQGPNAQCVMIEMASFEEAAKKYGYPDFTATLMMANITQDNLKQSTLLLPLKSVAMKMTPMPKDNATTDTEMEGSEDSSITIEGILEYFIPNKTIDLEEIENEAVFETETGHSVRFNVYARSVANSSSDYDYRYHYTANCVSVVMPKIFTASGMVLGLEKQITVAEVNLMDLLRERDDLSMFTQMVENFNLTDLLVDQDSLTVFAPNDDAFANLNKIEQRMLLTGDECASEYASNHILGLTLCSSAIVSNSKAHVKNMLKHTLSLERDHNGTVVINAISRAIETDIMATNGVLHVVDNPFPTDAVMTVTSLLENRNSSIFAELLMKSGFADQFEDLRGVTFFVPTDKALQNSEWKRALDNNTDSLKKNATLYEFLSNHIVDQVIGSPDFRTAYVTSMAKQKLKMNLILNHPSGGTTLNCARFVSTDGVSCNRAIHQIDRVLEMPQLTMLQALESNKDYSKFLGIIKRANLTHLTEDERGDITLLVPTNDVFEEQNDYYEAIMSANVQALEPFVKMHMVLNSVCCSSIPKYPVIHSVKSVNGISLVVTRQRRPLIANAHITKCDILLKNGIIFEINDIIEIKEQAQRSSGYF